MSEDTQPQGFLNRSLVTLFLVFTIPAALTLAGTYYVAQTGRVPGGEDTFCERAITDDVSFRIDVYTYTAGLVQFQTQTFSYRQENIASTASDEWITLFSDTMPNPETVACETNVLQLNDSNIVLQNQKSMAWSSDGGSTWAIHNICDDPRPQSGRCDAETLNIVDTQFNADGTGILYVQESAVDGFGEPQRDDNNNPIADDEWRLLTDDFGQTWFLDLEP